MAATTPSTTETITDPQLLPKDPPLNKSFAEIVNSQPKSNIPFKNLETYKGEPTIIYTKEDVAKLSEPFKYTLVGKFSHGKPTIEVIRKMLSTSILSIAKAFGKAIKLDGPIVALTRPSQARICVENDLKLPLTQRVWIVYGENEGFWQYGDFENFPEFCEKCDKCDKPGHDKVVCKIREHTADINTNANNNKEKKKERAKEQLLQTNKEKRREEEKGLLLQTNKEEGQMKILTKNNTQKESIQEWVRKVFGKQSEGNPTVDVPPPAKGTQEQTKKSKENC